MTPDDSSTTTRTTGRIAVGGPSTSELEAIDDRDRCAVALDADSSRRLDLEGSPSRAGPLRDPLPDGSRDASGHRVSGTGKRDGGTGRDIRFLA